ncbi:MAG: Lrp/AsnC family transcriptional regulator [Clostridia bacterium]|nr:Lrp/AsnC family transcriptional regulator [Clostridia bacterium]MBQ3154101.1 Lrp/AsnC family transcriptional regulator [Clostridia bacterium]
MIDKNIILSYLENDSHLTAKTLAVMLGVSEEEIKQTIAELEKDGTILSYKTIVNWEKTDRRMVRALIELKTIPQRDKGFDAVAERVSKYDEVKSVFLMSGGFDLALFVEGETMRDVALFVAEKLATMEGVTATATHFVLQTYKDNDVVYEQDNTDKRGNSW